jgi:excisionase family DNA binding protein
LSKCSGFDGKYGNARFQQGFLAAHGSIIAFGTIDHHIGFKIRRVLMPQSVVISAADIEEARRGIEALRSLAGSLSDGRREVAIEVDGNRVGLEPGLLRGLLKVLDVVAGSEKPASEDDLTPRQAAAILKLSCPTVMRLIERGGHLTARLVEGEYRLDRQDVLRYRDSNAAFRREALANIAGGPRRY